jgi:hypothetical protein
VRLQLIILTGLTGYIPRLTLEHRLPKCLMPPPAPQPAADTQAEVQAAAPAIMTEQPEIVFQTQPPADQATCTAVRQRVSGPQAGSTAAADGSVLMAQSTNTEQASPTEQAPPHVLHLYAWLMRPCPSPLPHQLDPLGSTIYDRDHARDLFERSWAWAESKGLCSHSAHAGGDSSRTSSEARKVERDSAEVAAAMGGITAHVSAAGSAAAGGGEAPDAAPSSNERTATSSKSRLQWLHPFGVLLHQKLPEGGTLPSSVWMDRGVHALAYPLYLGPQVGQHTLILSLIDVLDAVTPDVFQVTACRNTCTAIRKGQGLATGSLLFRTFAHDDSMNPDCPCRH